MNSNSVELCRKQNWNHSLIAPRQICSLSLPETLAPWTFHSRTCIP